MVILYSKEKTTDSGGWVCETLVSIDPYLVSYTVGVCVLLAWERELQAVKRGHTLTKLVHFKHLWNHRSQVKDTGIYILVYTYIYILEIINCFANSLEDSFAHRLTYSTTYSFTCSFNHALLLYFVQIPSFAVFAITRPKWHPDSGQRGNSSYRPMAWALWIRTACLLAAADQTFCFSEARLWWTEFKGRWGEVGRGAPRDASLYAESGVVSKDTHALHHATASAFLPSYLMSRYPEGEEWGIHDTHNTIQHTRTDHPCSVYLLSRQTPILVFSFH